jgi:hypothetical protein
MEAGSPRFLGLTHQLVALPPIDIASKYMNDFIEGTRIPVDVVLGMLERGFTVEEIVAELPTLTEDAVRALTRR